MRWWELVLVGLASALVAWALVVTVQRALLRARAGALALQFNDVAIAAIRDPAVRHMIDRLEGRVGQLDRDVLHVQANLRDQWARFDWVQYREGNPYAANAQEAERLRGLDRQPPSD